MHRLPGKTMKRRERILNYWIPQKHRVRSIVQTWIVRDIQRGRYKIWEDLMFKAIAERERTGKQPRLEIKVVDCYLQVLD